MSIAKSPPDLIGQSAAFLKALEHVSRIAMVDRPIVIAGERGSGKSLLAARTHFLSTRWEGPLVAVACGSIRGDDLDVELFGRETGSGAQRRRRGAVDRAQGGTLFLKDIDAAPHNVQQKLLHVIEHAEYAPMGAEDALASDVRIIASSTTVLRDAVRTGSFLASLLDRLSFDVIAAPPLRDREDDIPLLAAHFGAIAAAELGLKFPGFSPKALSILKSHSWPGNVRELKNCAERAVFHWGEGSGEGQVDAIVLDPFEPAFGTPQPAPKRSIPVGASPPHEIAATDGVVDLRARLDAYEKELALAALARTGGSQKAAAGALGLSYDQMRGIIKKHGIVAGKQPREKTAS